MSLKKRVQQAKSLLAPAAPILWDSDIEGDGYGDADLAAAMDDGEAASSSVECPMLGAIIGDMAGSLYEFTSPPPAGFPLLPDAATWTDDTLMTIAVADALVKGDDIGESMRRWAGTTPIPPGVLGYGARFSGWLHSKDPEPYNSFGNGSAMRVSPIGWAYGSLIATLDAAKKSAEFTHNHPEGIKGAQAVAGAIFLARTGASKAEIKQFVELHFGYDLDKSLDDAVDASLHRESCQATVPEAFIAFLNGTNFQDVVRKAVRLGGDADTRAAIAGSIAEAYYGIPHNLVRAATKKLPAAFRDVLNRFTGQDKQGNRWSAGERFARIDSRPEVRIVKGDITRMPVDAIVNAANTRMRGGGGVDGAIHQAGGPAILVDCIARFPDGLPTGAAGWTTAGDLPAKWVIHTVGPNYRARQTNRALLTSCYRESLMVADELGAETVAFPLISAGIYGWPIQDAIRAAIETLLLTPTRGRWHVVDSNPNGAYYGIKEVLLVAYNDETNRLMQEELNSIAALIESKMPTHYGPTVISYEYDLKSLNSNLRTTV